MTMQALTFHAVGDVRLDSVRQSELQAPDDAIVRVTHAAVCGSDLHVYHGRETGLDRGTVMGHEFTGVVHEAGAEVRGIAPGDRVACPFSTACGACFFCTTGLSARCERGRLFGWVENGTGLHGGQAAFVRVPMASSTLVRVPEALPPPAAVLLGDVLPTGFYCARRAGISRDGVYAVLGCGPVGLMAIFAARELGAKTVFAFDRVPERLRHAERFGATPVDVSRDGSERAVHDVTGGRGADAVLEAVGSEAAARLGCTLVRPGGTLSMVGVHTEAALPISPREYYDKNLTVRMGRCPARSLMDDLLPLAARRSDELASIFTHALPLSEGRRAYEMFDRKADGCVKVLLET